MEKGFYMGLSIGFIVGIFVGFYFFVIIKDIPIGQ